MFRVNQLTDYASLILVALSRLEGEARLSSTQVADRANVEPTTAAKVLKMLTKAELVHATRGQAGGYRLAQPAATIHLQHVIEAMEGPIGMTRCVTGDVHCDHTADCGVQSHWHTVTDEILRVLKQVSIADMASHAPLRFQQPPHEGRATAPPSPKKIPLVTL